MESLLCFTDLEFEGTRKKRCIEITKIDSTVILFSHSECIQENTVYLYIKSSFLMV
jgi:hypothetical protein